MIVIAGIAIAIATFGVMVRGIRAATVVRAAKVPGTTAMKDAARTVPPNPSATPASASSRLAKSMRPALTRERAPAMRASDLPTSAASAVNGAAEAGADVAGADVTAAKTPRMARAPTRLKEGVQSTISPAQAKPIQARLRRRHPHPLTSVRQSVPQWNRFVSSHR